MKYSGKVARKNVRWLAPPDSVIKINTEVGVSKRDKRVGFEIIMRNHRG